MTNFIAAAVIVAIVGAAAAYIIREKRRGVKCVGCPYAKTCGAKTASPCSGSCSCHQPEGK